VPQDHPPPPGDISALDRTGTRPVGDGASLEHAHSRIQRIYHYWRSIRPQAGGLPGRQHLDPADITDLLPYLWLLDVQREPLRLRYRLVGTAIVRMVGRDFTGAWIDEAHPQVIGDDRFAGRWRYVIEQRLPTWRRGKPILFLLHRDFAEVENIYLPFARNGVDVDQILAYTVVYRSDGGVLP
jgi:hypothetical protein